MRMLSVLFYIFNCDRVCDPYTLCFPEEAVSSCAIFFASRSLILFRCALPCVLRLVCVDQTADSTAQATSEAPQATEP